MSNKKEINSIVTTVMNKIEHFYEHKEIVIGIDSGFTDFNSLHGGVQNELLVIASGPCIGKTALVMGLVLKMARGGLNGVVFSCDISSELLTQRLIAMETGIPIEKMSGGFLKINELSRIKDCCEQISKYQITIEDEKNYIDDIIAEVRSVVQNKNVKWIVIDSFNSIHVSDISCKRNKQIAEVSGKLKALQAEIGIPFIVTLGLKRNHSRNMSIYSDLSEYRVVEKDADALLILQSLNAGKISDDGCIPVKAIVAKQKNGDDCVFDILFNPNVGVFHNKQ